LYIIKKVVFVISACMTESIMPNNIGHME